MKFAFGVLRISPDIFWNMTMIEFLAALDGYKSTLPKPKKDESLSRKEFEQMLQMFPDD